MRGEGGGFFSAEDADSEGHEGRFYLWTWDEVRTLLGKDAPLFCEYYGVTPTGNFEGNSILHMRQSHEEFAAQRHLDPIVLKETLKGSREKLFNVRKVRVRPIKDDKVLTAWNGLMIHALAEAGMAFNHRPYLEAAVQCAQFIRTHLFKEGNLLRRWREGEARFDGCLDDYACMIQGSISLFEADMGTEWLEFALTLAQILREDLTQNRVRST